MCNVLVLKALGKKNGVFDIEVEISCFFCDEREKGVAKVFRNLTTLISHIEQVHKSHPLYKKFRNAIKSFIFLKKYFWQPHEI